MCFQENEFLKTYLCYYELDSFPIFQVLGWEFSDEIIGDINAYNLKIIHEICQYWEDLCILQMTNAQC